MQRASQWDLRINVPTDDDVNKCVENVRARYGRDNVTYVHVSGVERDSTGNRHVHIALILENRTSERSIIRKYVLQPGHGFYASPRDMDMDLDQWILYHSKPETKEDPDVPFLYQAGTLPRVRTRKSPEEIEEQREVKRSKRNEQWERRKYLVKNQMWDTLDQEFPGFIWTSPGQNMKRELMKQSNTQWNKPIDGELDNWIIWGDTGTGKSSSISLLFPECYKKQKGTQYWDAYDVTNPNHAVVWIDEFSKETLKTLVGKPDGGFEFLKELADRYPVTVDEKYTKGYKIRPKKVIITMNEHPESLLPDRAVEVNKKALYRKFKIVHISAWLTMNNLRVTPNGCEYIN